MTRANGKRTTRGGDSTVARLLRTCGRVTLWGALAVVLGRGLISILERSEAQPIQIGEKRGDEAVAATAERFARLYLEDPSSKALRPFLAAGAQIGVGRPASARGAEVAQAAVIRRVEVGDGRVVVTVSCELRDSRTLYLVVPIVRLGPGEAAVLGAPSIVAVPAVVGADPEQPRPLAGPEAPAIGDLVSRFLPAYLSAADSSELAYLLAPGTQVIPLAGSLELDSVGSVNQLGDAEGPTRHVLAVARVREPVSGAVYQLTYRLRVVERAGRWYVDSVEGAIA